MHLQLPSPIGVTAVGHPDPVQRHTVRRDGSFKRGQIPATARLQEIESWLVSIVEVNLLRGKAVSKDVKVVRS